MHNRTRIARSAAMAALWLVAAVGAVPVARGALVIEIGDAAGPPGAEVTLAVRVRSNRDAATGLGHDLLLPAAVTIPPRPQAPDKPDCRIDPALLPGNAGAGFYWGPGATLGARVVSSAPPLPEGAVLYTCTLQIDADAAAGRWPIDCRFADATTVNGDEVAARCVPGALRVDAALPASTPTPTPPLGTPTPTATACPDCGPLLVVGELMTVPGERVELPLVLRTGLEAIAGIQADIAFPPQLRVAANAQGQPHCTAAEVARGWSGGSWQPPFSGPDGHTAIRILVLPPEIVALPDNLVVMRCAVDVAADAAPGSYALPVSMAEASTIDGEPLALPARDGSIHVLEPPAEGQRPVVESGAAGGSGSCAVAPPAAGSGWLTLLPALLLALRRRR